MKLALELIFLIGTLILHISLLLLFSFLVGTGVTKLIFESPDQGLLVTIIIGSLTRVLFYISGLLILSSLPEKNPTKDV